MSNLDRILGMGRFKKTFGHWFAVDGALLSAAVAFNAALALFPVLLVLLSIFGWLLSNNEHVQNLRTQVLELITEQTSQNFSEVVASQLDYIEQSTSITGTIGVLSLFAFSMAFFTNLERAFGKIWQLPREPFGIVSSIRRILVDRIRAYLMILLLVIVVVANFLFGIYLEKSGDYIPDRLENEFTWWAIQLSAEILLNAIFFTGIFQIMTREKVRWRHAIYGGFLTALLWQPGKYLIGVCLISDRYSAFGIVGAFWAVLLWIYYGIAILLFGATVVYIVGCEGRESDTVADS